MTTYRKVLMYVCRKDYCVYHDKEEAQGCCYEDLYEVVRRFSCDNCGEEYEERDEAVDCCNAPRHVWACGHCSDEYESEDEARRCCMVDVTTFVDKFKCIGCDEIWDDSCDADACCKEVDEKQMYECLHCTAAYDSLVDAGACCAEAKVAI